jgi:hypothetical protein
VAIPRAKNAKEQRAPSKAGTQRDFFALFAPLRLCTEKSLQHVDEHTHFAPTLATK